MPASPEKAGAKPVQPTKEDSEEKMECESAAAGEESDMNVDSPPPSEQMQSEDGSSSTKAGEFSPTEGATASTSSTRSDLQDPASSAERGEGTSSGSTPSDSQASGSSPRASGSPASALSPQKGVAKGLGVITSFMKKISPRKKHKESDKRTAGIVSPKSKGKSPTPEKGETSCRQLASPGEGSTLSPTAAGEASGSRRVSPLRIDKPSRLKRMISPTRDTTGDQAATAKHDYHEDPEQAEDAPLTEIRSPASSEKPKGGILSIFTRKQKSKSTPKPQAATSKNKEDDCLHLAEVKGTGEDASDATVSISLSPCSTASERRGAGLDPNYFETDFEGQTFGTDEVKAAVEAETEDSPERTGDNSELGATSGEPSVGQPAVEAVDAEESTDDAPLTRPASLAIGDEAVSSPSKKPKTEE